MGSRTVRSADAVVVGGSLRTVGPNAGNGIRALMAAVVAVMSALASAPVAHAEDSVTYDVFSDSVAVLSGIEYRDVGGKHLLQGVALPWILSVPVVNAFDPEDNGAELRADWRPDFRTAATVGRVLQGQFVTVRISLGGKVICESTLDVGNATCYGSVPHSPETSSSYDQGPLFPPPDTYRP
jgi:hypothetical protein